MEHTEDENEFVEQTIHDHEQEEEEEEEEQENEERNQPRNKVVYDNDYHNIMEEEQFDKIILGKKHRQAQVPSSKSVAIPINNNNLIQLLPSNEENNPHDWSAGYNGDSGYGYGYMKSHSNLAYVETTPAKNIPPFNSINF